MSGIHFHFRLIDLLITIDQISLSLGIFFGRLWIRVANAGGKRPRNLLSPSRGISFKAAFQTTGIKYSIWQRKANNGDVTAHPLQQFSYFDRQTDRCLRHYSRMYHKNFVEIRECTTRTLLKIVRPLKVRHNRSDFHDKSHPFRLMKQSTTQSGIATAAQRPRTSWAPNIKPAFLLWFIQKCETRTLLKVIQTFPARHNPSDFSDKSDPFRSIKQSTTESKMATTAQRPGTSWQEISPSFPWLIQKYKTRTLLKTPHPTFPYNTVNRLLQFIMPTWAESQ